MNEMTVISRQNRYTALLAIILLLLLLTANVTFGSVVIFEKEYTYQAGEADSKLSCRAITLEQVKRLLLEELGVYLEEKTEVKNYQLTKNQITLLTAGIVGSEIVDEKWDGRTYYLKAKISADPDDVAKRLDVLRKDEQKTKELEAARKKTDELLNELGKLKSELNKLKDNKREKKQKEINAVINGLNANDWYEKGHVLGEAGNYMGAIEAFTKSIELDSKNAWVYGYRGYFYYIVDKMNFAKDHRFISNPKEPKEALKTSAYSKKALNDFNTAIKLNAGYAGAYYFRGMIYLEIGYSKAEKEHSEALEMAYKKMSDEEAERSLKKLYKADAASIRRMPELAKSLDYQKGIQDLDKVIELDPENTSAYLARGNAYIRLSEYQQGISDYNRVVTINPQSVDAYLERANVYSLIGNRKQANDDYTKALELDSTDARIYYFRAINFSQYISTSQYIEDLKKATELNPQNAWYYFSLGLTYLVNEEEKEGIAAMKISARLGSKDAQDLLKIKGFDW